MLPAAFVSKMDHHIQIGDANLRVTVIDTPALLAHKLTDLKASLGKRVVGVSLHQKNNSLVQYRWLYLCTDTRCLMIDLIWAYTDSLGEFLSDENICFAALDSAVLLKYLRSRSCFTFKTCFELGDLGCRVKKIPTMRLYNQEQLAAEIGVDMKPQPRALTDIEWKDGMYFSTEQIKCAVYEVYFSFAMAYKLLVG